MKENIKNAAISVTKKSVDTVKNISQDDLMKIIDTCYDKTLSGFPGFKSSYDLANEYLEKYKDPQLAANKLVSNQIKKCATSGFVTGLGGLITLPVAVPADLTACLLVQFQMIAAIAVLGGYTPSEDEVRTIAYICLIGESITEAINKTGVKAAEKIGTGIIDKIPGEVLISINKKLGSRIFTKFGETGIVNLCDLVPVLGGVVGGTINGVSTKKIGSVAIKNFIER